MKKLALLTLTLLLFVSLFGQATKPRLMVVPSDNWCVQNGFMQEFDNQGMKVKVPDYKRAMQENFEVLAVISKIGELMSDRGFPLERLDAALKSIANQTAEDNMTTNRSGEGLKESPIDILRRTANADIWVQISWQVNTTGPKKSVSFILDGIDAYTNNQIAASSGTGAPSFSAELPVLLQEAVVSHLDNFNAQLQNHFTDMFDNGRIVGLRVVLSGSFDGDMYSEYGGKELNEILDDWVMDNSVQHRYNQSNLTDTRVEFKNIRIPLYDNAGKPTQTLRWARGMQKYLKDNYKMESKVVSKGLGEAQVIIGEK
jgi:hypothetical protein